MQEFIWGGGGGEDAPFTRTTGSPPPPPDKRDCSQISDSVHKSDLIKFLWSQTEIGLEEHLQINATTPWPKYKIWWKQLPETKLIKKWKHGNWPSQYDFPRKAEYAFRFWWNRDPWIVHNYARKKMLFHVEMRLENKGMNFHVRQLFKYSSAFLRMLPHFVSKFYKIVICWQTLSVSVPIFACIFNYFSVSTFCFHTTWNYLHGIFKQE